MTEDRKRQHLADLLEASRQAGKDRERQQHIESLKGFIEHQAAPDPTTDPDPVDIAIQDALNAPEPATAVKILMDVAQPPALLKKLSEWENAPVPAPVIWQADSAADPTQHCNPVLSSGEVAVLSGPGGLGKSTLALSLAVAAASAKEAVGQTCGLYVRAGDIVLVSYEDAPVRIIERVKRMAEGKQDILDRLHLLPNPAPLFEADPEQRGTVRPGSQWRALWRQIQDISPTLVVIDPASAALGGLSMNEGGPVRALFTATREAAEQAGCGVLIIAHDTKAARNEAAAGQAPGAGVVAGSATWYDATRGVLYLCDAPDKSTNQRNRLLTCVKANYGRAGWQVSLVEKKQNGQFCGFTGPPLPDYMKN